MTTKLQQTLQPITKWDLSKSSVTVLRNWGESYSIEEEQAQNLCIAAQFWTKLRKVKQRWTKLSKDEQS